MYIDIFNHTKRVTL